MSSLENATSESADDPGVDDDDPTPDTLSLETFRDGGITDSNGNLVGAGDWGWP